MARKLRLAILYNLRENFVLKIKIDKVTVIRVYLIPPFWRPSPVGTAVLNLVEPFTSNYSCIIYRAVDLDLL